MELPHILDTEMCCEGLKFNRDFHLYSQFGRFYDSATQILVKVGIGKDMTTDSPKAMERIQEAAEWGTFVHADIDRAEKEKTRPETSEGLFWMKYGHPLADEWKTEVMFCTDEFAGTCDAIGYRESDDTYVIVDHKTGIIDETKVRYQLNLYRYGLQQSGIIPLPSKVELICYDAKGYEGRFLDIDEVPDSEIRKLLDAYKKGKKYELPYMPTKTDHEDSLQDVYTRLGKTIDKANRLASIVTEQFGEDSEESDLACSVYNWLLSISMDLRWDKLLEKVPMTVRYDAVKRFSKSIADFETELKIRMLAAGMDRAKTSDGYLWTLSQSERSNLSKDLIRKHYPGLGKHILRKATTKTNVVRLTYKGKEELKNNE